MVTKVLRKRQTNFNRLDFKNNNGNYQETTRKTSILGVKKAEGLLNIYIFETFLLPTDTNIIEKTSIPTQAAKGMPTLKT